MIAIRHIGLLLAGVSASVIPSASAGTIGYPGSSCNQIFGSSVFYDGVIARNQASTGVTFICNAIQMGGVISAARVSVRDVSSTAEVLCFARSSGEFDTSGFQTPSVGSGAAFVGTKALDLGSTSNFVARGSKNVACIMPPKVFIEGSGVASYSITEL